MEPNLSMSQMDDQNNVYLGPGVVQPQNTPIHKMEKERDTRLWTVVMGKFKYNDLFPLDAPQISVVNRSRVGQEPLYFTYQFI